MSSRLRGDTHKDEIQHNCSSAISYYESVSSGQNLGPNNLRHNSTLRGSSTELPYMIVEAVFIHFPGRLPEQRATFITVVIQGMIISDLSYS